MTRPITDANEQDVTARPLNVLPERTIIFARIGEYWMVGAGDTTVSLKDIRGLRYIQRLLQHPGEEFHALDLMSGAETPATESSSDDVVSALRERSDVSVRRPGDAGPMLDDQAKSEYKRRISELNEELEELKERGAHERAAEVEVEVDFLVREIARAVGLGGRDRSAGSATERARLNVTRAIKSAVDKIGECDHSLGEALAKSIRTGSFCSYIPHPDLKITWRFALGPIAAEPAEIAAPLLRRGESDFIRALLGRTIFVGRGQEMERLRAILEVARGGRGKVVTIAGPLGVGKSRTAAEFCAMAAREGFVALTGCCYDRDSVPFVPFVEILEAALAAAPSAQGFRDALGHDASEIARLMPQLRRLFPDIGTPVDVSPEQSRRLLFNAVVEILTRYERTTPILLAIEDLHWGDEGTLAMLSHISRSIGSRRIVVVATYRDNELIPGSPLANVIDEMLRGHLLEQITLRGLPEGAIAEMLRALSRLEPPREVVRFFAEYTKGQPLFIEELYQHLAENGQLFDEHGDFHTRLDMGDIDPPTSLRLVIARRLSRLSEPAREVLGTAAVIGNSLAFDLLELASGVAPDTLLDLIEEVERAGVVSSSMEHLEARFHFAHELIRQIVIGEISPARRQRLHLRIADAIERLHADELGEHANDLAHHLWHSGTAADSGKTLSYLGAAAKRATDAGAYEEAIGQVAKALEVVKRLPRGQDQIRQELELRVLQGVALVAGRGYLTSALEEPIARMLELSDQVEDATLLFPVLLQMWVFVSVRGDHAGRARELIARLLRVAESVPYPPLSMWSSLAAGVTYHHLGEYSKAEKYLEKSFSLYDRTAGPTPGTFTDPGALALIYLALTQCVMGRLDRCMTTAQAAIDLAREKRDYNGLAHALHFAASGRLMRGDAALALALCNETLALASEHQFPVWIGQAKMWRGAAQIELGRAEEGMLDLLEGISRYTENGAQLGITYWATFLARGYLRSGLIAPVIDLLDQTPIIVNLGGEGMMETELYRLKGEVLLAHAQARREEAVASLRRAIDLAHERGAMLFELRATISLAGQMHSNGESSEARRILGLAYGSFSEGFDTEDLKRARELLSELSDTSSGRSTPEGSAS